MLTLLELIKQHPPNLKQRLRKFSSAEGKISEREFFDFCNDLNIQPPHFTMLLRDVAGFRSGYEVLEHDVVRRNLNERIKPRKDWEKDLFRRINRTLAERQYTPETLYDNFKVDDCEDINHEELGRGLQALGVHLGSYDLNYIFYVFDRNRNNLISLKELRDTLKFYEEEHDRHHDDKDDDSSSDDQERTDIGGGGISHGDGKHDESKPKPHDGGKPTPQPKNLVEYELSPEIISLGKLVNKADLDAEHEIKPNEDPRLLNGVLKIQVLKKIYIICNIKILN